jgi:Phospholipase_D-nuclease N-terminal
MATATAAFWFWMLLECLTCEPRYGHSRMRWTVIVSFTPILGALIYYFARRERRYAEFGR